MNSPTIVLNDGETFSGIDGCIIVDDNGIAYDAHQVWNRLPITIREGCRIGLASDLTKLKRIGDSMWP